MNRIIINLLAAVGLAVGVGAAAYLDEKDRRKRWGNGNRQFKPRQDRDRFPKGRSYAGLKSAEAWRDRKRGGTDS